MSEVMRLNLTLRYDKFSWMQHNVYYIKIRKDYATIIMNLDKRLRLPPVGLCTILHMEFFDFTVINYLNALSQPNTYKNGREYI
jgi:hypothetical protein